MVQSLSMDLRSRRVEERSDDILALWTARKDITLEELRASLVEMGLTVSVAGFHRFFVRLGMTRKKDCSCSRARSARCPEATARLVRRPDRSGTRTPSVHRQDMDRDQHDPHPLPLPQGRTPAHRLAAWSPQTTTLVAGLRMTGMVAPMVLDGPINGDCSKSMSPRCSCRNCGPVTSSSWATCRATNGYQCGNGSRRWARRSGSCRHTALTSIQSKRPSPNSKQCCERQKNEP